MYYNLNGTTMHTCSVVLDFKRGDVNGDKVIDNVYLMGNKPFGASSPFADNITLVIQDGRSFTYARIPLKVNSGYNPTLFLGNFTKDRTADILISIDSGGSGGLAFYYLYSFLNNKPRLLFDFEQFNSEYQYYVVYKDNYKVEVTSKKLNKKYTIDIVYKGSNYLSEIYDENGNLIKPVQGAVIPLGGLYPVDFDRDGTYELYAIQRIIGRFNADTLGYMNTILKWDGSTFIPTNQNTAIIGYQ